MKKRRIMLAYSNPIVKLYCLIRLLIIRINILEKIEENLRGLKNGHVLDVGAGFGLFALYNASRHPGLHLHGLDLNARRIASARRVQKKLAIHNASFYVGDARDLEVDSHRPYRVIYMLDILHHIPVIAKYRLLRKCHRLLDEDGILIVKDVDTRPAYKLYFTYLMDRLMCPRDTFTYQSHERLGRILARCGFEHELADCRDWLPYPHVMLIARKKKP